MTMPFYVSPEQLMKDRADFARKGIARGRSVIVLGYDGGMLFVADNPSRTLNKVSEIYDRIAFAAVGKYNEFENLRVAGIRYADLRGYSYDRADVTARALANAYAQTLGTVFTQESKPYEVELVVAEVGPVAGDDQIYRLTFDGSVADEQGFVAIGGESGRLSGGLAQVWRPELSLVEALRIAVELLGSSHGTPAAEAEPAPVGGQPAPNPTHLEVALLDRTSPRRAFRRVPPDLTAALVSAADPTSGLPRAAAGRPGEQLSTNPHTQHPH
ncbi:MAG TPA: proteasome subunit alpha [Dermatophilaceae bacterium]|nr:proteasome subunit alpha [Dermatophilaceae bacterium]